MTVCCDSTTNMCLGINDTLKSIITRFYNKHTRQCNHILLHFSLCSFFTVSKLILCQWNIQIYMQINVLLIQLTPVLYIYKLIIDLIFKNVHTPYENKNLSIKNIFCGNHTPFYQFYSFVFLLKSVNLKVTFL